MKSEYRVLKKRIYGKWGYQLIYCVVDGSRFETDDFQICQAFTYPNNEYIGDSKLAYRLCVKRGIAPQSIEGPIRHKDFSELPVDQQARYLLQGQNHILVFEPSCRIGFCKKDNKWYGWSHRAIFGFGIGHKVKPGSIGFKPSNKEEMLQDMVAFYINEGGKLLEYYFDHNGEENVPGILIKYTNPCEGGKLFHEYWVPYPRSWGRGEWKAKTLNDAKQMAIDFAESI